MMASVNQNEVSDLQAQQLSESEMVDQTLLNLDIIAKINEKDKLCDDKLILEIDTRYFQLIQRPISGNSRHRTIERLTEIIGQAMRITDETLEKESDIKLNSTKFKGFDEDGSHLLQRFSLNMSNSLRGMHNLKKTYQEDVSTCAKIDLLINKTQMRIDKINDLLKIDHTLKQKR